MDTAEPNVLAYMAFPAAHRVRRCYGNALMEGFFYILTVEFVRE